MATQTPKLVLSPLTGHIYIVTRYKEDKQHTGVIVAQRKYDASDDFRGILRDIFEHEHGEGQNECIICDIWK